MALPIESNLPTSQGVIYTCPTNVVAIISTIHISNNSGSAATFTLYMRVSGGTARPISAVNQALANNGIAIAGDPIRLTAGCTIEGIASASGVSYLVTGKEIAADIDRRTL